MASPSVVVSPLFNGGILFQSRASKRCRQFTCGGPIIKLIDPLTHSFTQTHVRARPGVNTVFL